MQNRKPLDLDDITDLSRLEVKFNQHKNRILNTKTGIFNSIIALGDVLPLEIAKTIGHRSLKLLAQKLSKIEEKQRISILQSITEYEHYNSIKNRINTITHE